MREEIAAAVVFVTRLIKTNDSIPNEKIEEFSSGLSSLLIDKFKNHWYTEIPTKGQGYRCIRINPSEPIDPVLKKAAAKCGLEYTDLNLPQELTLWVDPKEVCCRFDENQGLLCQLTVLKDDGNMENQAHTVNIEDHLQQQQRRQNMNLNIVTTRTSVNKLRALNFKNATSQQQRHGYQHSKQHQNAYNNNNSHHQQQQQSGSPANFSGKPFHKSYHNNHKNGYQSNQNNGYVHHGSNSKGGNNFKSSSGQQQAGKDRFHWVRKAPAEQSARDEVEKMRTSPDVA